MIAAVLLTSPVAADAHLGNISYADFAARGNTVEVTFKYAAHVTPGAPQDAKGLKTRQQVLALQGGMETWLRETALLASGGKACTLAIDNIVGPDHNEDLIVVAVWTCEVPEVRGFHVDFHPLTRVMRVWQTICSVKIGDQTASTVLTPDATRWTVGDAGPDVAFAGSAAPASASNEAPANDSGFVRFFHLGVEHIWTGYDHLLFLLAVLLAGGGLARLAAIVTSFTIAHSITLGAAATGLVHLPVAPVEAAIALSIVYVACENLLELGVDRRAQITFGFGLIHGFGFASVLAETALPPGGIVVPLLAFNLGVEAGQLAVVLVVVPILTVVLRGPYARRIRNVLSALIALAGAIWAVERIAAMF